MSLIRINNVTVRYEDRPVLREAFFRLEAGDRVGLIGRNGAGKTTLIKLVLGQVQPSEGLVDVSPNVRIGYFSQFSELNEDRTVVEIFEEVFAAVRAVERELEQVSDKLADEALAPDDMDPLLARQAQLFEDMERLDGWNYRTKIETVLNKLGFRDEYCERPIAHLSGGWRNRAALGKILLEEPDVLLLDEPTNYLDLEGVAWLETWLNQLRGAFLLVSHDRHFLDRVISRIVEIENYHTQEYDGNYTEYVRAKPFRLKTLERQFLHEQELLACEAEAIVERREDARDPSMALKRKIADVKKRAEPRPVDLIVTDLYALMHPRRELLLAEDLTKAYGGDPLFHDVTFELHQGERLAIVGPNGCGKSTLLKVIAGEETPDAGRISWPGGVKYAHFNAILRDLPMKDTVSHAVNVVEMVFNAPRKQVHKFLSLLRFSEMDVKQKIGTLSGGQQARVALAQCLLSGAQVVILDEPTNHLDMMSIQVMERALIHFPGAVIVVSHDRFFIDKIATRLLIFEDAEVKEVNGNWTIWQSSRGNAPA